MLVVEAPMSVKRVGYAHLTVSRPFSFNLSTFKISEFLAEIFQNYQLAGPLWANEELAEI